MTQNLQNLVKPVRTLAIQAGLEILRIYRTDFAVEEKADRTPLTEADTAANEIIVNGLTSITPKVPVIAEETPENENRLQWPMVWMVDPLDGTREFVKRSGEFSVNIALIDRHRPVLGLVYMPHHKLIYWATEGGGAFKQLNNEIPTAIHSRKPHANPPRILYGHSTGSPVLRAYLNHLGTHEARQLGSAYKSCQIAEGLADLYPRFGPTCWPAMRASPRGGEPATRGTPAM